MAGDMDIVATGMVCSVGLTAATACAAMRAKVAKFNDLPYRDNEGEPIVGAVVPGLPFDMRKHQRLVELLCMALRDCLGSGEVKSTERIPLIVGLAEPERPGGAAGTDSIIREVEAALGLRFNPKLSRTIPMGHVAGFEAMRQAREILKDGGVSVCLVCGVDSLINAAALRWLEQHDRLKTPGNSDGVIPGEGAAGILVSRPEDEPSGGCVARIIGLGFAHEKSSILTEEPLLAEGLASAGRSALAEAGLQMHEIDFRLSDVSGESYGFREQALVGSRLMRVRRECLPIWHCADAIGDTGAAAGVCQMIAAQQAFRRRHAPGRRAIGFTSSTQGARAAAVLERQVAPKA
jgi:3-oxoacyl-[acyl-carrier-protein] synthase-1